MRIKAWHIIGIALVAIAMALTTTGCASSAVLVPPESYDIVEPVAQAITLNHGPGSEPDPEERMGVEGELPGPETFAAGAVWMNPYRRPVVTPIGVPRGDAPALLEADETVVNRPLTYAIVGAVVLAIVWYQMTHFDVDLDWSMEG